MSKIVEQLAALQEQMNDCVRKSHNRSPKPLARLKASLANSDLRRLQMEEARLKASLPGSTKSGLERGRCI